jgi:hypothetical protein
VSSRSQDRNRRSACLMRFVGEGADDGSKPTRTFGVGDALVFDRRKENEGHPGEDHARTEHVQGMASAERDFQPHARHGQQGKGPDPFSKHLTVSPACPPGHAPTPAVVASADRSAGCAFHCHERRRRPLRYCMSYREPVVSISVKIQRERPTANAPKTSARDAGHPAGGSHLRRTWPLPVLPSASG